MFQAKHLSGAIYLIYSANPLGDGETEFLIYHVGMSKWIWMNASEFKPV